MIPIIMKISHCINSDCSCVKKYVWIQQRLSEKSKHESIFLNEKH